MNKHIEELLESDDELPMDYYEVPATPAYQIDSRFDVIKFKWINNTNLQQCKVESNSKEIGILPKNTSILSQLHLKPILNQGVLNNYDLFCIKSIEGFISDATLIWLINFSLCKDLQANYLFLKSCLVGQLFI